MALATQCPHCGTTFRVAHDQLKLRAGLVRCGACKEIFNGIEHLLPAAAPAPTPTPASAASETAAPDTGAAIATAAHADESLAADADAVTDADADADAGTIVSADQAPPANKTDVAAAFPFESGIDDEPGSAILPPATTAGNDDEPAPEPAAAEPLYRMTLMDFAPTDAGAATRPGADTEAEAARRAAQDDAALERALDDLQDMPPAASSSWLRPETPDDFEEPDFIARARRQRRSGRARRILLTSACALLLLAVLGQAAYALRDQIAARFPQAGPLLAAACAVLACRIDLPMQIENVTIESSELQALAPDKNAFVLSVLLRNRSATVEAWPSIELTLNDAVEQPLVRRVFGPRDYLAPPHGEAAGFAAASEQAVRIYFELATPKAAGYRVYLFYP